MVTRPAKAKGARSDRQAMRFPTKIVGSILLDSRYVSVTIDDLSERGAHISTPIELAMGTTVTLRTRGLLVAAVIVRATPHGYGLRLSEAIRPLSVVRANLSRSFEGGLRMALA